MARLPDVTAQRPAPRNTRGIASISPGAASAVADAFQDAGGAAQQIGLDIQDREATAAAKEADVRAAEEIRKLLYDPETGFANQRGGVAVGQYEFVTRRLEEIAEKSMEGLSDRAKRKAKDSLAARVERGKMTVDTHTSGERRTWINGASEARAESAYQDALVNPGEADLAFNTIAQEYAGMAAREGWSAEELNLKLGAAKSKVHGGIVKRIADVNPEEAAAYLAANRDKMLGSDVVELERDLIPMAKAAEGRRIGSAVAGGGALPAYRHTTKIEFSMGPNRPNKPQQPVLDVIGKSAEDVFGKGARVVVTSGQEDEGHQHGSNRHGTGHAADVAIYRPDGTKVKATDPDMAAFAKAAAQNGALGIGFGAEYMGGEHVHVDLVAPGAGQANTWGSAGTAMRGEIVGMIDARRASGGMGLSDILEIEDPMVRKAALDEYELRSSVANAEAKQSARAASEAAFQHIESGGALDKLPFDAIASIGLDGMTSLRAYERSKATGVPVETDMGLYAGLRLQAATDPTGFRDEIITDYAGRLSESDMKSLIELQAKPPERAEGLAASTLMSVATGHLRAIGVKPNDPREAVVQTQLLKWQDAYIFKNGQPPSQLEADQQVGRMLTEVVIDPAGMQFSNVKGRAFESDTFDIDADGMVIGEVNIGGVDVPQSVVQEQIEALRAAGEDVTTSAVINRIVELMDGG